MNALVAKNISIEGPGTLGSFLQRAGYKTAAVDLQKGEKLPRSADDISLFVLLGGPMNAYEEDKYPFLLDELKFLELCFKSGTKVVGLCLGAQMIARALGAKVTKNGSKEIGWFDLELTNDGVSSPLFEGLPNRFSVFQWHGDTFSMPAGAVNLAESDLCKNQAFACNGALALQFHLEIQSVEELGNWCDLYREELTKELGGGAKDIILDATEKEIPKIEPIAEKFYGNIHRWVGGE